MARTKLDGGRPFNPPKDWAPRLRLRPAGVITDDEAARDRVAIVLTEDDYHSVSDPLIREDPSLHEHNFPALVWYADDQTERSIAGLMAAIGMPAATRWRWLLSTFELQAVTYGYDYEVIWGAVGAQAHYLDWNVTAAIQELAEVREEFSWKPWATDEPFVNRDRVRDEVVDVLHFLGNILVGIGVTDDELEAAYQAKQEKNRARVASGNYSARKGGLSQGSDV